MMSSVAFAQTFNCAAGRIVYAKKYTDLFSEYTGTAAVVETCAATCAQQPQEDKMACFLIGCGLSCLAVGMSNCVDYFSQKNEITKFKDGVEKICAAEEYNANSGNRENDQLAWSLATTKNSPEAFKDYIKDCNSVCAYKDEATSKIRKFQSAQDDKAWAEAKRVGSIKAAQSYLDSCNPRCAHRNAANRLIRVAKAAQKIEDDKSWEVVEKSGLVSDANRYLRDCAPTCSHSDKARRIIDDAQRVAKEASKAAAKAQMEAFASFGLQLFVLEPRVVFLVSPQNLFVIAIVAETL